MNIPISRSAIHRHLTPPLLGAIYAGIRKKRRAGSENPARHHKVFEFNADVGASLAFLHMNEPLRSRL
jgi:hypothetical protein